MTEERPLVHEGAVLHLNKKVGWYGFKEFRKTRICEDGDIVTVISTYNLPTWPGMHADEEIIATLLLASGEVVQTRATPHRREDGWELVNV